MSPESAKHVSYIKALLIAMQVAKEGGTATIELFDDESGKLESLLIDQAGAQVAVRAIIGDAVCWALDEGTVTPGDVQALAGWIAEARRDAVH